LSCLIEVVVFCGKIMSMTGKFERIGTILYVKNYEECIDFYSYVLKLKVLFSKEALTCFDFFGTYLMIEKEDRIEYLNKECSDKAFSCIRIHVSQVKEIADCIQNQGIPVQYEEHSWGIVAKLYDPDGNLIAFKDEESFVQQILDFEKQKKSELP